MDRAGFDLPRFTSYVSAAKRTSKLSEGRVALRAPHSTVTDLARLRGWSTSLPMKTAV
jgi:hypothetical protein